MERLLLESKVDDLTPFTRISCPTGLELSLEPGSSAGNIVDFLENRGDEVFVREVDFSSAEIYTRKRPRRHRLSQWLRHRKHEAVRF